MAYLIDADGVIQALAGRQPAVETLDRLAADGISISLVTVGEIYEGAFGLANPQAHLATFRQFLNLFSILNLNDEIMVRFAQIRTMLRRSGQLISDFDILVGATALHYDLTVLTFNTRHLARVPELKLFRPV